MSTRNRESRAAPVRAPRRREARPSWTPLLVGAAVAALLAASFVVPPLFEESPAGTPAAAPAAPGEAQPAAVERGDGPDVGSVIRFSERDVVTGAAISSETLRGRTTLLFFSEGVMCQACFVQIRDLERIGDALRKRGIDLISITPDSPELLRQAIDGYGIRTPMISDHDRDMSRAFDTLGQGMHPDTPGHAFVLVDERGAVAWQRDYWLEPYRTMYVEPKQLLAEIPQA